MTLLEENKLKPVLQVKFERSSKAGIQRIKLSEHGVKLAPNVEYQWVVALVTDPDNRSSDLVASGAIKRIEPSAELRARIAGASPAALPGVYAEAGISAYWRVERHPEGPHLHAYELVDGQYVHVSWVRPGVAWRATNPYPVTVDPGTWL